MPDYDFQHVVLKNLNIIRLVLQQQGELLSSLIPPQPSLTEAVKLLEGPLESTDQLQQFEEGLTKQQEKHFVLELSLLGGHNTKVAVRRMLSYVITDELGRQYSWEGKKGKLPFRDLRLPGLILRKQSISFDTQICLE
ncbi:uncharacterized protein LOC135400478 [Ornithodoros turicata]|uniref:uncharacterized protein LOC135400478 n=1 Tax=Ornithodoros turicata TaxID=34597 RepID=UPI0031390868